MGYLKDRIIEVMEPREEPPMEVLLPKGYEMTITPQPWIPASDQMPDVGVRCIIATRVPGRYVIDGEPKDGHEIEFGEWTGDRWKCFSIPCVSIMHPSMVSHWMPMPETPVPRPY